MEETYVCRQQHWTKAKDACEKSDSWLVLSKWRARVLAQNTGAWRVTGTRLKSALRGEVARISNDISARVYTTYPFERVLSRFSLLGNAVTRWHWTREPALVFSGISHARKLTCSPANSQFFLDTVGSTFDQTRCTRLPVLVETLRMNEKIYNITITKRGTNTCMENGTSTLGQKPTLTTSIIIRLTDAHNGV